MVIHCHVSSYHLCVDDSQNFFFSQDYCSWHQTPTVSFKLPMTKHLTFPLKLAVSPVVCILASGVTIHPITQVAGVSSLTSRCVPASILFSPVQSASYSDLLMPLECLKPLKHNPLPPEKAPVLVCTVRPLCFSLLSDTWLSSLSWAPAGPYILQSRGLCGLWCCCLRGPASSLVCQDSA